MRTTVTVDDSLMNSAMTYACNQNAAEVIREAIRLYVEREAGRRLALLGGTLPHAQDTPPRRQL